MSNPAIFALAGFVPCAESGIITFVLFSPIESKYFLIIIMPVISPWAPAEGFKVIASIPVIFRRAVCKSYINFKAPWAFLSDVLGWILNPSNVDKNSFTFGLYFIVQEPSG